MVWSATYDSFGNARIGVEAITNNLRFPGQYYDSETGLHYNLNRYYDPATGRYLRTDPFREGINLYNYVSNNPISWTDPFGLCKATQTWRWFKKDLLIPGLKFVHEVLTSRWGVAALSTLDMIVNIQEVIAGAAMVTTGTVLFAGSGSLSSPVSLPIIAIGSTTFVLGMVGAFESYQRIRGSIDNDRDLMNYDYFETHFKETGKDYVFVRDTIKLIQTVKWIRRPVTHFAREGIPWIIDFLRYEKDYGPST